VTRPQNQQRPYPDYPGRGRNGWYDQYGYNDPPPVDRRNRRRRFFQPYYDSPPPQQYQPQRRRRWFFRGPGGY